MNKQRQQQLAGIKLYESITESVDTFIKNLQDAKKNIDVETEQLLEKSLKAELAQLNVKDVKVDVQRLKRKLVGAMYEWGAEIKFPNDKHVYKLHVRFDDDAFSMRDNIGGEANNLDTEAWLMKAIKGYVKDLVEHVKD